MFLDSGHSFDAILFYGHEFSLIIFDIMVFSFVDLFAEDFLLATIVTFFVGKVHTIYIILSDKKYIHFFYQNNIPADFDVTPRHWREIQLGQEDLDRQTLSYLKSMYLLTYLLSP